MHTSAQHQFKHPNLIGIERRNGDLIKRLGDELCLIENAQLARHLINTKLEVDKETKRALLNKVVGHVSGYCREAGLDCDEWLNSGWMLVVKANLESYRYWEALAIRMVLFDNDFEVRSLLDFQLSEFEQVRDKRLRIIGITYFMIQLGSYTIFEMRHSKLARPSRIEAVIKWIEDRVERLNRTDRDEYQRLKRDKETDRRALSNEVMTALWKNRHQQSNGGLAEVRTCPNAKKFFDHLTAINQEPFVDAPPISPAMRDYILFKWLGYGPKVEHPGEGHHSLKNYEIIYLLQQLSLHHGERDQRKYAMRDLLIKAHETFSNVFAMRVETLAKNYLLYLNPHIEKIPDCLRPENWR